MDCGRRDEPRLGLRDIHSNREDGVRSKPTTTWRDEDTGRSSRDSGRVPRRTADLVRWRTIGPYWLKVPTVVSGGELIMNTMGIR